MVVADYQNDVVPVEDSHHLKPDVGLVRVRWDRAQKGQVDALQGRTRAQHRLWECQPNLQGQGWDHKAILGCAPWANLWDLHPSIWLGSKPWI